MPLLAASLMQWSPKALAVARLIWFFSLSRSAACPFWMTSFSDAAAMAVPDSAMAAMAAVNAMRIFMFRSSDCESRRYCAAARWAGVAWLLVMAYGFGMSGSSGGCGPRTAVSALWAQISSLHTPGCGAIPPTPIAPRNWPWTMMGSAPALAKLPNEIARDSDWLPERTAFITALLGARVLSTVFAFIRAVSVFALPWPSART